MALDTRVTTVPSWLSDWNFTGETIKNNNDVVYALYSKNITLGETVTLGTNGQTTGCVGYTVFAVKTFDMPFVTMLGDVNADGSFDLIDIVLLKNSITIDCRHDNIDTMSKAFIKMSSVFNEFEKDIIRARVKSGVANAKANGKQVGRRYLTIKDIPQKVKDKYPLWLDGSITKVDFAKMCDISRPTLDRYIKIIENNK